jgi:hypothetical protein
MTARRLRSTMNAAGYMELAAPLSQVLALRSVALRPCLSTGLPFSVRKPEIRLSIRHGLESKDRANVGSMILGQVLTVPYGK